MKKLMLFFVVVGIALAAGGYLWYSGILSRFITQKTTEEAAQQVTTKERFQTKEEWIEFNKKWLAFQSDTRNTWEEYVAYSQGEGARYACDQEIMQVGEEKLYGCDLNALFILMVPDTYIQPDSVTADNADLISVVQALIVDSGLLQEAQTKGWVSLTNFFYNSPEKNMFERYSQLKRLRREFDLKMEKTVDFEAIVIYFHNQIDPKIPVAEAKTVAKKKMDILHNRLKNGEISMQQAGDEIKADAITGDTTNVSLANLDQVFTENAYLNLQGHTFNTQFFKDIRIDDILRELPEGGISNVEMCKDYKFTAYEMYENPERTDFPFVESCYLVLKVNKVNYGLMEQGSEFKSAEEFLLAKYHPQTIQMMNQK